MTEPAPEFSSCFTRVPDRLPTHATKWRRYADRDILPFWVADMDFASPGAVREALHERIDHGVFGYTDTPSTLIECVLELLQARYGWNVKPEWLVWLPGVAIGFNLAAVVAGRPESALLIPRPIYYPFLSTPDNAGRPVAFIELEREPGPDGQPWWPHPDSALAAAAAAQPGGLYMLCNPHNPTGRVYTRAELERLAEIARAHDLAICADEIHCDLLLTQARPHLPFAVIAPDLADRTITLMAPTKTYNLAGLGCSFAVIPDRDLRRRFVAARRGLTGNISVLSYTAAEAAWRHGDAWLDELRAVLRHNHRTLAGAVDALPGISMTQVEATCLAWIDCGGLDTGGASLQSHFETHGLGLGWGAQFGRDGFVRFNFGCPPSLLNRGLERLANAVRAAT